MARIDLNRFDKKPEVSPSRFDASRQDRRQDRPQQRGGGQWNGGPSSQRGGGQGRGGQASQCGPATAPYNFIPYDPERLTTANEEGERYSGVIRCRLVAKTPLLVCGPQKKEDKQRRFLTINGKPTIPGSSLKGMLRNIVEILSHSHMTNVNATRMFWRDVTGCKAATYKAYFEDSPVGGFLKRDGSRYVLYPASVSRGYGADAFTTGSFGRKPGVSYLFSPVAGAQGIEVPRDVMEAFLAQMTPYQEKVWKREKERFAKGGARVFYARRNGEIICLGLARYFRVPYKYTVRDKVGQAPDNDFTATLFGHAGKVAVRGKVAIGPAVLENAVQQGYVRAVLGQPHPTCLLHYLEQPGARDAGNRREDLISWDDAAARPRGWKYYWHRDQEPSNPDAKDNVRADYYPLNAGASGTFDVHVEQASLTELGALLEALQLPAGHCHKLGSGKTLGFGSVRIEIEKVEMCSQNDRYRSLAARFAETPAQLSEEDQAKARKAFHEHVEKSVGRGLKYEQLDAVKAFMVMTDFDRRPPNGATRTMPLEKDKGEPNFAKSKALLPRCDRVGKQVRP